MPSPVQVLDQQLRLLQADVRILKTSIQGVDVLTKSVVEGTPTEGIQKADVVAIAEKVASSAVASVKADCATVAKVEAGVTVRSMIPTIKADCVNVAKTIVGSGEDLKNMKRDTDELKKNYTMLKESYDTLLAKVDKLSVPKKAPARKVADKQSNKDTEPDSEMMII
jgi:hypothetical protein